MACGLLALGQFRQPFANDFLYPTASFLVVKGETSSAFLDGVAFSPVRGEGALVGETGGLWVAEEITGVSGILADRPEEGAGYGFANGSDGPWVEFAEGDDGVAEGGLALCVGMEVAEVDED